MSNEERVYRRVAVGIGSNLGDREECLRYALRELERGLERVCASSVYRSDPVEGASGGEYLNMCAVGRWSPPESLAGGVKEEGRGEREESVAPADSASRLLDELRFVEIGAGRSVRRRKGEPRCLDLDLLLFGDATIRGPGLEVPHPRMNERAFVLRPLSEIAPDWWHPEEEQTVGELARRRPGGRVTPHGAPGEIA